MKGDKWVTQYGRVKDIDNLTRAEAIDGVHTLAAQLAAARAEARRALDLPSPRRVVRALPWYLWAAFSAGLFSGAVFASMILLVVL